MQDDEVIGTPEVHTVMSMLYQYNLDNYYLQNNLQQMYTLVDSITQKHENRI